MKTLKEYKRIICESYCGKNKNGAACSTCYLRANLTNNFELSKDSEDLIELGVLADGKTLLELYHKESLNSFKKLFGLVEVSE